MSLPRATPTSLIWAIGHIPHPRELQNLFWLNKAVPLLFFFSRMGEMATSPDQRLKGVALGRLKIDLHSRRGVLAPLKLTSSKLIKGQVLFEQSDARHF